MADHCWHHGGNVYLSVPAQWDEYCCWCGERRTVAEVFAQPPDHGPLARPVLHVPPTMRSGTCPSRPSAGDMP